MIVHATIPSQMSSEDISEMYCNGKYSFILLKSSNTVISNGNFGDFLFDQTQEEFVEVSELRDLQIESMACCSSCALFLSNDGMVYSFGIDKGRFGLLGSGDCFEFLRPKTLDTLYNFTIRTLSISETHACATDLRGKLYTWGTGTQGQLGHGPSITQCLTPQEVMCTTQFRITSAIATPTSTLFHCAHE